jgi:DNA topoisomerase I
MKLVIVESPAKSKTIQKYLGKGYKVTSSYGHIRDLPKSKIGVDPKKNFTPEYVVPDRAKKNVEALKKAAKKAEAIYLATDADREGEAIAWHLAKTIGGKPGIYKRISFAQITKAAITEAVSNPRKINQDLVDAQQARRILDRLVGYELSPLLWEKIRRGLSAGRVQSVTVRLVVEKEEEIEKFKPEEYWSLTATLAKDKVSFEATISAKDGKSITKKDIKSKKEMDVILKSLAKAKYSVKEIKKQDKKRTPPPPFTTSTLQQASFNKLGYSSKKTMMLAQQLYEGLELGAKGPVGLITYMRTDSLNLAKEATAEATALITKEYGPEYAIEAPRVFTKKSKGAQEAHEAIRPSKPGRTPDDIASYLANDQLKLYRLIWQRMVASQMADAKLKTITTSIDTETSYQFRATGTTVEFDGFAKVLGNDFFKETILPTLETKDKLDFDKLNPEQHFTQPPARYSEATLVKALEKFGIGRPSTYAPTIDTIQKREYVIKNDDKRFAPSEIGTLVTNLLKEHFPDIVSTEFTATVEEDLDKIASGDKKWQPIISDFYKPFHKNIEKKKKELSKEKLTQEKTGEKCPDCKNELIIKLGRFGKFKACSNYPDCKFTENIGEDKKLEEEVSKEKCPECKKPLALKHGRFGPFMGCSGYPDCKHIKKIEKMTGAKCPKCKKGDIVEKKSKRGRQFFACNQYPDCENAYWSKPTGDKCPKCKNLILFAAKNMTRCSDKECDYTKQQEITDD